MLEADEQRHEHRSHRAGVDRPVRVTARLPVDRADVQTRSAADAVQHLAVAAAPQLRAAVVEHDHVQLVRPILLTGPPGPGEDGRVGRQLLPGRATGQEPQEDAEVARCRHEPFHAEDDDVRPR